MEEFSDPYRYIAKISEEGQKYGICLIVPPVKPKHKVTDLLDRRLFSFNTKLQPLHQLLRRWSAPSEIFLAKLDEFRHEHQVEKKHLARQCPKVCGNALDLYRLFRCVMIRGGAAAVSARAEWSQISKDWAWEDEATPMLLKAFYSLYLEPFERHMVTQVKASRSELPTQILYAAVLDLVEADIKKRAREWTAADFGFKQAGPVTLAQWEKSADVFERSRFPGKTEVSLEDKELDYWTVITTERSEQVVVPYGNDLDLRAHLTPEEYAQWQEMFPPVCGNWNLSLFATAEGSLLRNVERIPGVCDSMLYIGQLYSTFCWHYEDYWLPSANVVLHGAPKIWYGVPTQDAQRFEQIMKAEYPHMFTDRSDLLHLLITMVPPHVFKRHGLQLYRIVQEEGQIVLTFPKAYHAGWSSGFNVAEAVNFAPPNWLPFGRNASEYYRSFGKVPVFSFEELIIKSSQASTSPYMALWLSRELKELARHTGTWRELLSLGVKAEPRALDSPTPACSRCNVDCYISHITCQCGSGDSCLSHVFQQCACFANQKRLHVRLNHEVLESLRLELTHRASALYGVFRLDAPKFSLPSLREAAAQLLTARLETSEQFKPPKQWTGTQ